jgi:hypothetical protein
MNEFTRKESELVLYIHLNVMYMGAKTPKEVQKWIMSNAKFGVKKYAQKCDWDAAAQAVIELVKERLSEQV